MYVPVRSETIRLLFFAAAYLRPESADSSSPISPESPVGVAFTGRTASAVAIEMPR
ncbi:MULTISPECIES: hypothetical protein [Streptomyces]|uniref:hypothetical protein n=1 Tax=Streptomyces TaxID=1883 RepID=UPI001487948E|nr:MULTISPECIES: hypothetical protein [Streptomyces]